MTYRNYYSDGTVSVSNGSTTVTVSGTAWELFGADGGMLIVQGRPGIPIASVTDDGELELLWPWPHASSSGLTYAIGLVSAEAATALFINRNLSEILRKVIASGVPPDGIGSLTERDALDPTPATGFIWLRAEVGEDLAYYFKTDSGWLGPKTLKGDKGDDADPVDLDDLGDVTIGSPATGDVLRFSGAGWVNDNASGWEPVSVVGGEATFDIEDGDKFLLTVDAACEIQVPANAVPGAPFALRVVMDGSYPVTFAAGWLGNPPAVIIEDGDETVLSGIVLDTGPTTGVINLVKHIPAT